MKNINLHFLNALCEFSEAQTNVIKEETFSAFHEIHKLLPQTNLDIVFMHAPRATIPEEHIGGRSTSSSHIFVYLDAKYPELNRVIKEELKKTLAHEYHHACRWKTVGYGQTLGEALITEGLADHFTQEVFKCAIPRWSSALSQNDLEKYKKEALLEINSYDYNHVAWFFGDKKIPRWAGYSLGYEIVRSYMQKNSTASAAKMADTPAKIILDEVFDF